MSAHSALNLWTEWDMSTALPPLTNCTNMTCAELCFSNSATATAEEGNDISQCDSHSKNSAVLWDPHATTNLATCGLWWTVAMATHWNLTFGDFSDTQSGDKIASNRDATLKGFSQVGLDLPAQGFSIPDIPALECFANVLSYKTSGDALNLGKNPAPWCSVDVLFGYQSLLFINESNPALPNPISACLQNICSTKTPLNQDIGGIGVFASFMMQSSIAIMLFFSLTCLRYLPSLRKSTCAKKIFDTLVTAVVEFQKAQCYFAGAIQIATIVLASSQASYSAEISGNTDTWDDYINDELFYIIATNGYIPVVFTLAYISMFGRRSWYLISLSFCSMVLSTVTLSEVVKIFKGVPADIATDGSALCGNCGGHTAKDLVTAWCPPNTPTPYFGSFRAAKGWWNWGIWLICLFWLVYTVSQMDLSKFSTFSQRWLPNPRLLQRPGRLFRRIGSSLAAVWRKYRIFYMLFPFSWATAFGYQYGGFVLFFLHSEIVNSWSFGQIVAITVWVPCVAEFIYLLRYGMTEGSAYRLPRNFTVIEKTPDTADSFTLPNTLEDDTEIQVLVKQSTPVGTPQQRSDGSFVETAYDPLGRNDGTR